MGKHDDAGQRRLPGVAGRRLRCHARIRPTTASVAHDPTAVSSVSDELLLRTGQGLVLPEGVALMLDTPLTGERPPSETRAGRVFAQQAPDDAYRHGAVMTTASGEGRRIFTNRGAAEYRYELSINEVVGDAQSMTQSSYRLPIIMSNTVRIWYTLS